MLFSNQQKSLLNSVNILWKNEKSNEATKSQSIAKKIATRVNANTKNKDPMFVNKTPSATKPSPTSSKA
ncbi:24379_t:CDS:1, partial [Dentiscutata erythropus]